MAQQVCDACSGPLPSEQGNDWVAHVHDFHFCQTCVEAEAAIAHEDGLAAMNPNEMGLWILERGRISYGGTEDTHPAFLFPLMTAVGDFLDQTDAFM